MAAIVKTLAFLLIAIAAVRAQSKTCKTYLSGASSGCTYGGAISFSSGGSDSDSPNTDCKKRYRLIIDVPSGKKGFSCTFRMNVPEQSRYVYSLAESSTASGSTSSTPYIYGRGLDARISTRTVTSTTSPYRYNYQFFNNIHTHVDNNQYSYITYRVQTSNLRVYSSAGHNYNMGHPYWFTPTSSFKKTYIGVNMRYSTTSLAGSGVCEVSCYIIS